MKRDSKHHLDLTNQTPLLHLDVPVGSSAQTIPDGVFLPIEEAT